MGTSEKLNAKKSAGPDDLPGKLIKGFACELSTPVADIFNASLREGRFLQGFRLHRPYTCYSEVV